MNNSVNLREAVVESYNKLDFLLIENKAKIIYIELGKKKSFFGNYEDILNVYVDFIRTNNIKEMSLLHLKIDSILLNVERKYNVLTNLVIV